MLEESVPYGADNFELFVRLNNITFINLKSIQKIFIKNFHTIANPVPII